MYLERTVESPDLMQPVVQSLVLATFYERGPKFPLCGWLALSRWREAGLFQVNIQPLHLIRVGPSFRQEKKSNEADCECSARLSQHITSKKTSPSSSS